MTRRTSGIDDYNDFVDEYNTRLTTDAYDSEGNLSYDASEHDPVLLKKITTSGANPDLPEDHIGKPENYWSEWRFAGNGVNLSANTYSANASVNGSISSEWSEEAEQSETKEETNGLYVDVSVQYGGGSCEAWIGIHVSVESSWGHSSTTTKTKANGTSGEVNNINKSALLTQGVSAATVDAYQFNWTFGKWTRKLTTSEDDPEVPFFGYQVFNVMSPLPPPQDLSLEEIGSSLELSWDAPEIYNPSRIKGYNVYLTDGSTYSFYVFKGMSH